MSGRGEAAALPALAPATPAPSHAGDVAEAMRPLARPRRVPAVVASVALFQAVQVGVHLWLVFGLTRPGGGPGQGRRRLARLLAFPGAVLPMVGAPMWTALILNLIEDRVFSWVNPAVAAAGLAALAAAACLEPLARHVGAVFGRGAVAARVRRAQLLFLLQGAGPVLLFLVLRAEAVSVMAATIPASVSIAPGLLSLVLGLAGFAHLVLAGRDAGRIEAPAPDATTPRLTRWRRALTDAGLDLQPTPAGFEAEGFVRGLPVQVQVDLSRAPAPGRIRLALPALAATHPRLRIVARDPGAPPGVPLSDPILARLLRVRGVPAQTAEGLLADLHDAVLDVVQGLPGAALEAGRLHVPLALEPGSAAAGPDLDDALERCLALGTALEARVGEGGRADRGEGRDPA